jgi:hypothetical protein
LLSSSFEFDPETKAKKEIFYTEKKPYFSTHFSLMSYRVMSQFIYVMRLIAHFKKIVSGNKKEGFLIVNPSFQGMQ